MAKIKRAPGPTDYELLLNQDEVQAVREALGMTSFNDYSSKSVGSAGKNTFILLEPFTHPRRGTD